MFERFLYLRQEVEKGLQDGWLKNEPPNCGVAEMPAWPDHECSHFQLYEITSEGTPVSPVLAWREELAGWIQASCGFEAVVNSCAALTK